MVVVIEVAVGEVVVVVEVTGSDGGGGGGGGRDRGGNREGSISGCCWWLWLQVRGFTHTLLKKQLLKILSSTFTAIQLERRVLDFAKHVSVEFIYCPLAVYS